MEGNMSSLVKPDNKENLEQQTVSRKVVVSETSAPRTPFAEVNRQRFFRVDVGGSAFKCGQPPSKCCSWNPECSQHRQSCATSSLLCTLPSSKTVDTPLRNKALKVEEKQGGDQEKEISAQAIDSMEVCMSSQSLPSSPITALLLSSGSAQQLMPAASQSCPVVLSSDVLLSPISEDSPDKLCSSLSVSLGLLPTLSPESQTPDSPDLSRVCEEDTPLTPYNLSMTCEEGTPLTHDLSCQTESDVDVFYDVERDCSLSKTPCVSSFSTSNEGVSSEMNTSEWTPFLAVSGSQGGISLTSDSQTVVDKQKESAQMAHYILEVILNAVEGHSNQANLTKLYLGDQTFQSEYASFVKSYDQDECLTFANRTSSLTEVTSCSQDSEVEPSTSGCSLSDSQLVVVVSPRPFHSDSEESLSSSSTIQRRLTFEDRDMTSPDEDLDESFGCVRPSQSQMDLRENVGEATHGGDEIENSVEREFLNMIINDQKMEFFALPPKLKSVVSSPIDVQNQSHLSVGRELVSLPVSPVFRCDKSTITDMMQSPVVQTTNVHSIALSPVPLAFSHQEANTSIIQTTDVYTVTEPVLISEVTLSPRGVYTTEVALSPKPVLTSEVALSPKPVLTTEVALSPKRVLTSEVALSPKPVLTSEVALSPKPVLTSEVALSPRAILSREVALSPNVILTNEAALSPVVVPRREVDTMTMVSMITEVGVETERVEYLDHSMLATADMDNKTTMTDGTGHRNVFTTMTPFKVMAKEGRRLTSDLIRKQHPRALANQLETLTVANSRLESEARSAQQEHKRLQGALKEARQLASTTQAELDAIDRKKLEEWTEKEKELKEQSKSLEQLCEEQRSRAAELEQELVTLREESHGETDRLTAELRELQDKCTALEERLASGGGTEPQAEEKLSKECDSYRHQFERAQLMVREREAELQEMRGLFADLQTTACKQEEVYTTYQMMHKKIMDLASENHALRIAINNRQRRSEEEDEQQAEVRSMKQTNIDLQDELNSLRNTLAIHITNLSELEELYSVSSSDLLAATGQVSELNCELFTCRRALQEVVLSREAVVQQKEAMEQELSVLRDTEVTLRAALLKTEQEMMQQTVAYEKLQTVSQKMKKLYEDKLENMELGVENLHRILDNRETDMNNLKKDLYDCRNIILEQRYKIDGLESELRDALKVAATQKAEEEGIEFYKKSNAFLEAEREVYVESLRDLEDKLRSMAQDLSMQQQAAADNEQLVEELQHDKIRLISLLSEMQTQYLNSTRVLVQATEERERVESDVMACANDLLQHMRILLAQLKKKTGLQEVPEAYPTETVLPRPQTSSRQSSRHVVKSRRHARKSFVSSILGAVEHEGGSVGGTTEPDSDSESGSYLGKAMTNSVRKALEDKQAGISVVKRDVKEVTVTGVDMPQAIVSSDACASQRELDFSNTQQLSISWSESSSSLPKNTFRPTHVTSTSIPDCSLIHPPSSEPRHSTSGGMAKVLTIPRTEFRPEPALLCGGGDDYVKKDVGEEMMLGCVSSLKEVFFSISRLFGILDRATHLSLQDLREENAMLRERTEKLEDRCERHRAELTVSRQESTAKDSTILKLQQQCQEMTEQMVNLTDQKFQIRRLNEEVKRLESQLLRERKEKEAVSEELDSIFRRMETSSTSSTDGGASEARLMRDIVTLKKKNLQLLFQMEEQRNHYEDLGSKAARRMKVLDENWKKAEDELYRLDELVESIRRIAERLSPSSDLQHILRLIQGETKSSLM